MYNRVFRPGVAFTFNNSSTLFTMVPGLTHITHIGVLTTYGSNQLIVNYLGDSGRNFLSRCMRSLCAPRCQLLWYGIYDAGSNATNQNMGQHLHKIERHL